MLFSITMSPLPRPHLAMASLLFIGVASVSLPGCKRNDPPPDLVKTQRDAMERAKEVGKTMQKGVDAEGRKADEEGK
jgi:hypothetical protein